MKKVLFMFLSLLLGLSVMAQERIQLRSTDKAECVKSDMTSLKASFSFSGLEAQELQSERGVFSTLTMPNTVIGGNEGDPQIPVVNELIAVPYGAMPSIRVTSYSTTDYDLEEYGIHRLSPRQPDLRKDQRPEDVPFVYNEAAYQARGLRSEPMVRVGVDGILRGVQVGQMSIEPVSYDPVNNKIRVFNDIEVEVSFDGADARSTEDMLVKTYSPYFNSLYKQLFNGRAVLDVYDEHPDLWTAPVKMLVIANRMFEDCIQDWLAWKTTKGIYVDVNYTDNIGTSASAIKSFIQTKYAQDAPTFLMIMGDKDQVAASATGSETSCVTDLYYSSVDGDQFVDMFHSRFPAETVAQMTAMLNKALEYEQYTMPDPSYLNNVLLIAGEDSGWGVTVGRPTIWYATNYYYNTAHGFDNVYEFSHGTYTNCYSYLDSGVGFVNYTAHGSNTSWAGPSFTVSNVNNLTNQHKYFLAMGNCCQAADWGINGTCFGEAMVRAANKGAYAYIGSCPSTYWMNDYYFGVGPTNRADGTMPTMAETGTGCYDAIWDDDAYNTVNAILYIGNLAGNAAQALGYTLHVSTLYYWQAYHVLGDGSIMPYRVQPTANEISHMAIFPIGMDTYEVSAVPGSYVAISKDGVLHGTALVGPTGTVQVPITPVTSSGDVTICVTAPNRIPYIQTVPATALEGAYLSVDSYTPTSAHVGDDTNLSITFKNVGAEASIGNTNVTLTTNDPNVTVVSETGSFGALAPEATTTVNGFQFHINSGVADGTDVTLHYTAVNGNDTYEGNFSITANEAVLEYQNMVWDGGFVPGETLTVSAKFKNTGHYQATNAVATMSTTSNYISITNPTVTVGNIAVGQEVTCNFTITIAASCPETAQLPVTFTLTANGGLTATGNETLKNSCMLYFDLADSYGDGWNGSTLTVSFDDGTESQTLTIQSGNNSASYEIEVGNGVHVTLTWSSGSQWDKECSFTVSYEGDLVIYQLLPNVSPSSGVLYEFDCNCAAASQIFSVNVSSNNTTMGTVSGGGEYTFGQTCNVIATPAEGYYFMNWTQNGTVVSTSAEYSFTVNSDVNLVANFTTGFTVTVASENTDYGTVSGGGEYGYGATCTVTATPAEGYFFTNWTQNDEVVSNSASYSFTVINDINLVAHFAEGNIIGDGGTATNQYLPSYNYYNYSLSQQIYTAEELGEAGVITSIAFYNGGSEKTRTYDFYLKATTKSTFSSVTDWVTVTEADKVFSGSVTMVAGEWTFINFDTPFAYNGSANLVLVADDNSGTYTNSPHMACRVFDAPSQAIRIYSDGTNYDPTNPSSYSGTVLSVKNQLLFTKEIPSTDPLNVTVSANPAEGGMVSGGGEFGYEETCTVTAIPNEGYFFMNWTENGTIVSSDASYTFTVISNRNLVANFAEGNEIGDGGTETDQYLPSYSFYNYTLSQQIYTSEELGEAGVITSIAFYNGGTEKTRTYDFYMVTTDKTSFSGSSDWEVVTEADKVFSGSVTMAADDWTVITFTNPFIYDGTTNVILAADDNTGSYSSGMRCRVFDAPGQAIRVYSDGTNYDPFAPADYNGTVMDVKNQLRFTKEGLSDCMTPTHLTATEVGPNFVVLSWTENGASEQWYVVYGNNSVLADTNEDFLLEGLEPETQYTIMVRPACDENLFSSSINITTLEACPIPQELEVGDITGRTASLSWTGYSDSYLVQLGTADFMIFEGFDNGIPADWANDVDYPWTIVDGHIQSGNSGVANSSSSISVTMNFSVEGTIEFDAECRGEGSSSIWDKCIFSIDDEAQFSNGANVSGWNHYTFNVTAGEHTFTWAYTKDGSVNPSGDYFAIDNVLMKSSETNWEEPVSIANAQYTFTGLAPVTAYCVRVQGVCDGTESEWSEVVYFTTTEITTVTQTYALSQGWNWFSTYIEVESSVAMLDMLKEGLGNNAIQIQSTENMTEYDGEDWFGDLDDLGISNEQTYLIEMGAPCTVELQGMTANPANHVITINHGWNWIGFPSAEPMDVVEAFADFEAEEDDQIMSQNSMTEFDGEEWFGDVETLEPGQGYMYYSNSLETKTLIFWTIRKRKQ